MGEKCMGQAKRALEQEGVTFAAAFPDGRLIVSGKKGIAPMMELLGQDAEALRGAAVADRVIGRAAAFLLEKAGAAEVYAGVVSTHAKAALEKSGIPFSYGEEAAYIVNRAGTGMCPMEASVLGVEDADEAYGILREKLAALNLDK